MKIEASCQKKGKEEKKTPDAYKTDYTRAPGK